ncbi:MAG: asparaginase [Gemmatimonadota bacterium]
MTSVLVLRGSVVESRHRIHAAVAGPGGELEASVGDPGFVTFLRSAAKPFQALPLIEEGAAAAFGIPPEELALCCGSHSAEPEHVTGVRSLLARTGIPEPALECGPHAPMNESAARALRETGEAPKPIHNNCSGKHAGMLALASHLGWELQGYSRAGHPVQERMRTEVARWTGVPAEAIGTGVDGCGVVCFAIPLLAGARGYARLAAAAAEGAVAPREVVEAMTGHPWMVGGTGRLCTGIAEATGGKVFAKVGAEGVYCAGVRDGALGIALKVEDGARRAAEVALVQILHLLGLLSEGARAALAGSLRPAIRNTRGEIVGFVEPAFELARPKGTRAGRPAARSAE